MIDHSLCFAPLAVLAEEEEKDESPPVEIFLLVMLLVLLLILAPMIAWRDDTGVQKIISRRQQYHTNIK